jgi:hypothetical protein
MTVREFQGVARPAQRYIAVRRRRRVVMLSPEPHVDMRGRWGIHRENAMMRIVPIASLWCEFKDACMSYITGRELGNLYGRDAVTMEYPSVSKVC